MGIFRQLTTSQTRILVDGGLLTEHFMRGDMTGAPQERLVYRRFSHSFLRLLVSLNVAVWIIDILSPRYAHGLANGPLNKFIVGWLFISTIALPLYTGAEVLWMWSADGERRALWIDGILALVWSLFFWIRTLYLFTHRVMF